MSEVSTTPAAEARDPTVSRNARLLFSAGVAGVIACCVYFAATAEVDDPLEIYQGVIIFILGTLPSLLWAKSGGKQLPVFEVLMLTTVNTFAIPMFSAHQQLRAYTADTVIGAGWGVMLYQIATLATYYWTGGRPGRTPFFTREVLSRDINRYIAYGLTLTTVYTYVSTFYPDTIPNDLTGVFRAVFYGIGLVSVFVESRRWGLGELSQREQILFGANLLIQVIIQFSTLFLVGGISIVVLGMLGYISGSRRVPLAVLLGALAVTAILHNGKGDMRAIYWDNEGNHRQATVAELPGFFTDWVEYGITPSSKKKGEEEIATKLLDRTSLLQMLCLVMSHSPDPLPYLGGETYEQVPGQFVPRFFWPEKPVGHISTYTLAIYYGLQRPEDTVKTTIGFGMQSEAYANFGMFGLGLLGVFLGAFYKKVQSLCTNSPLLSYAGIFQIVLMAWSFQTEYPMSMWLSSMYQACIAVMGLPFVLRNFVG